MQKASPSLEQLLFCPPTDVLLTEDPVLRTQLSLMPSSGVFHPETPRHHIQHMHSLGCRDKITQAPYCLALQDHICLLSLGEPSCKHISNANLQQPTEKRVLKEVLTRHCRAESFTLIFTNQVESFHFL